MKIAIFFFGALLASVCPSLLPPYPYHGWPFLTQHDLYRASADQNSAAVTPEILEHLEQYGPDGRLFFNALTSLLTTTKITSTTVTSTCTVSTTGCSGKKRSILWREEDAAQDSDRDDQIILMESNVQVERKEREVDMPYAYQVPYYIRPSVGHLPYLQSPSHYYDPHVQGSQNARLFFFVFTSTSTISFTTTSRSTPSCSSSSNFPTC